MQSAADVAVFHFFIGVLGATLVCTKFLSLQIFAKEFVGTANTTIGSWGKLGGRVIQVMSGSNPTIKFIFVWLD